VQNFRGVGLQRDLMGLLDVHARQQPGLASLIAIARAHLARVAGVEAERYQADKARTLIADAIDETAKAFTLELERLSDAVPEPPPLPSPPDDDGATLDRLLRRLSAEHTIGGISALLREAESAGAGVLTKLWRYARPRLEALAKDAARRHIAPSAGSALHALTQWSIRLERPGDVAQASRQQRQRALRDSALQVADVVNVRSQVERLLRRTDVSAPSPPTSGGGSIVMGRYWEGRG
jgi:hypothetical protein